MQPQVKSSPNRTWTSSDLAKAILLTKGPICTIKAIQKNGPLHLRKVVFNQFVKAATNLQAIGLGRLEKVNNSLVYVKKLPDEVKSILEVRDDLCSFEEYAQKFYQAPPKAIKQATWNTIIKLGLVNLTSLVDPHHLFGVGLGIDPPHHPSLESDPTAVEREVDPLRSSEEEVFPLEK